MSTTVPERPGPRLTHVRVPLDGAAVQAECLWAEPVGGDHYRIANVPFFADDVALHDVVLALPAHGELEFVEVHERRACAWFAFGLLREVDPEVVFADVRGTGAAVECLAPGEYTANLFHHHDADRFETALRPSCDWLERHDLPPVRPTA
ncbi:MAG: DUF4265 domain-containing protein [Microthrixaceae bacterium]